MPFNSKRDTRANRCASLIMHHTCIYYLLSDESISLRIARNDVARHRLSHATKRFVSVHLSRSSPLSPGVYVRLQRVIASAIQSSRNYRAITRASRPAGESAFVNRDPTRVSSIWTDDFSRPSSRSPHLPTHILQFVSITGVIIHRN